MWVIPYLRGQGVVRKRRPSFPLGAKAGARTLARVLRGARGCDQEQHVRGLNLSKVWLAKRGPELARNRTVLGGGLWHAGGQQSCHLPDARKLVGSL